MASPIEIHLDHLAKTYRYRPIFTAICASVFQGETLVITGPNGSGKSTLLRIVCGLTPATQGQIRLLRQGQEVPGPERLPCWGLIAPELVLYDELTALENLEFFARVRGLAHSPGELRRRLAQVGLKGRGPDPVGTFSSGMKQRMKFAYALLHDPPVLLLDEPGSNLDEAGRELVARTITAQRQRGVTLLATNDPQEVMYGDRTLSLGE